MCIRDRGLTAEGTIDVGLLDQARVSLDSQVRGLVEQGGGCLLYTSDAADERSSVDLGGRRIIKNKHITHTARGSAIDTQDAIISSIDTV